MGNWKSDKGEYSSSCFLIFPKTYEPMIYADCGLVIEPNESELVDITMAASQTCKALLKSDPRVALLSFSTKGSANHKNIENRKNNTPNVCIILCLDHE